MADAGNDMPNGDRPNLDPNRNRDRDHVVPMPYWYSFMVACQIASMAGALGAIFPQPSLGFALWPSLRFLIWAAVYTFGVCSYYLVAYHLWPKAYNCWTWLILMNCHNISASANAAMLMLQAIKLTPTEASQIPDLKEGPQIPGMKRAFGVNAEGWIKAAIEAGKWLLSQYPRFCWATALSYLNLALVIACLILYSRHLNRFRLSRAPYTWHGPWRIYVDSERNSQNVASQEGHMAGDQGNATTTGKYQGAEDNTRGAARATSEQRAPSRPDSRCRSNSYSCERSPRSIEMEEMPDRNQGSRSPSVRSIREPATVYSPAYAKDF